MIISSFSHCLTETAAQIKPLRSWSWFAAFLGRMFRSQTLLYSALVFDLTVAPTCLCTRASDVKFMQRLIMEVLGNRPQFRRSRG